MVIDENGDEKSEIAYDDIGNAIINLCGVRLRDQVMETVCALPPVETALDQLIKLYGVETVAEVTGRGRRVVVGVVANIPTIPNAKVSVSRYDFSSDVTEKKGNKFRGEYDKSDQNNLHHFGNNSDDKTYTANTVKVWDKRYNEVKRINEVYVERET